MYTSNPKIIYDIRQHYMPKQNWNHKIRRQLIKMKTCRDLNKAQDQPLDRSRDQRLQDQALVHHLLY